jgi:hypothetical protein
MINTNSLKTAVLSAAIAAILGATALSIPQAKAAFRTAGNGGTLCKAAAGPGANVFYFDNRYAQNTSASVQYLSCQFVDAYDVTTPGNALYVNIGFGNPTASAATFTCAVQSGTDGYSVTNTAIMSIVVPANTPFSNFYLSSVTTPAIPARPNSFVGYTASCAVPAQGKVNMIEIELPGSVL